MASEFCPKCRAVRNVRVTSSRRKATDADDKPKTILTRTFHCETCNAFVRSEEMEENGDSRPCAC